MKATPGRPTTTTTRQPMPTGIVAPAAWPLVPDGKYFGPIIAAIPRKSPFPPRRRDDPRDDWKLYLRIMLEDGDNVETRQHLQKWRARHDGKYPVIFAAIPFRTLRGRAIPETPHLRDKMFKLMAMASARRLACGERFEFEALVGCYALVLVRACTRDSDGDPVARSAIYSHGKKILALKRVGDPQPLTENPLPPTHYPFQHPERSEGVLEGDQQLAAGRGVALPEETHPHHDRPADEGHRSSPAGSTPNGEATRIKAVYGRGADVAPRGPCPRCGERMWGRFGENGRCIWCEPQGRQR